MTLPQTDKPDTDDQVKDIISDIKENQDYIEANYNKQTVYRFEQDLSLIAGAGTVSYNVNTIGFQPSAFIVITATPGGALSFGYYGPSNTHTQESIKRYSTGLYTHLPKGAYCFYQSVSGVVTYAAITSTNSNGFALAVTAPATATGTLSALFMCLR